MRVALINPPSPYLENDASYPPSGLMYLAASLDGAGHSAEIVDLAGGVDWRDRLSKLEADLLGITCVTPNFNIVKEITDFVRSYGRPIYIGGVHPTFMPDDTLFNIGCDGIVKGEGEVAIKQLAYDQDHIIFRRIYEGGLVNVEDIPKPARHLVDLRKYRPGGEKATPVYTSRGCPFNCAFCSKITGRTYRPFSLKRVMEEVKECISLGFKNIVFGDDNIIVDPHRTRELMKLIKPLGIEFRLNQDSRAVDEETVSLAADAGCTEISFGIESGSQIMLDAMNKQNTVHQNMQAIKITQKYGIKAKAYFMVNFPGENLRTMQQTLKFAEEARPEKWLLSAFVPLPGSDTFHNPKKYGIDYMSTNWEDYYLVGKDGSFKPCFTTKMLSMGSQIWLHDTLRDGLKRLLG